MKNRIAGLLAVLALVSGASAERASAADPSVVLREAWPGVAFENPIQVACPKDGSDRLFVVQRGGKILVVKKYRAVDPIPKPQVFLDLSSVFPSADFLDQSMGGLLGLAFHPDYKTNGRFFVFYGTPEPFRAIVASYKASSNPDVADPASAQVILTVPKVQPKHFGGSLAFGPDGYLYVGLGDQAKEFDSANVSQDMRTLEGKLLRIDVNSRSGNLAYGIPADNPWAASGGGVRGEIWAYGLRNPFRFSFDREKGTLWLGDPGQKQKEEIDVVPRAGNMGWPMMEGGMKTPRFAADQDASKLVAPAFEYGRETGKCCIGGVVYRGQRCPSLAGSYIFSDYMTEKVLALTLDASGLKASGLREIGAGEPCQWICSIDEDAQGEIYLCSLDNGKVMTLAPAQ